MSLGVSSLPDDLQDADAFAERLSAIYSAHQANEIIAEMATDDVLTYWLNPLRAGQFEPTGQQVDGLSELWSVPRQSDITANEAASTGEIYIQNPSSYFAVTVLDPQPDEEILDLAAAPGGKTIAIAARMGNSGRLAAVEPIKQRFHRLRANVERCGVSNVEFYMRDGRGVGKAVPERFDRVLLDAPCSSESRMRWGDVKSYKHWSLRKIKETQRKQKSLLRSAYSALKPGGVLVYCTCSFAPEENERVVQHLLRRTEAVVEPIAHNLANAKAGLVSWRGKDLAPEIAQTMRIIPHEVWDGFFIARLRKPI